MSSLQRSGRGTGHARSAFRCTTSYRKGLEFAPDNCRAPQQSGPFPGDQRRLRQGRCELSHLSLEPGAIPRTRQNLALALGLKGDTQGAAKLLSADLDQQTVSDDLRYFPPFAGLRKAHRNRARLSPAAAASLTVPGAAVTASPRNSLPDRSIEPASQTIALPQRVEVASVAAARETTPPMHCPASASGDEIDLYPRPGHIP